MTVTRRTSGRSSRQHDEQCFSEALAEVIDRVPGEVRAIIYPAIRLLELCNRDDIGTLLFWSGIDVLVAAIQAYRPLGPALLGVVSSPLGSDCNRVLYSGVCNAVADIVCRSKPMAIKAANAMRRNLVGNGGVWMPLGTLAPLIPDTVLSVLHDGLCADPDLGTHPAVVTALSRARPGRRTVHEWLRSPFPGPRVAMQRLVACRGGFAKMFPPSAAKAGRESRVVKVAGRPGCQSPA